MIITKNISVTATGKLLTHLKNLGYEIKSHQKITIPVEDLPENTRKKIIVRCDICNKEYDIMYKNYLQSVKNGGVLTCIKCKGDKFKTTCLEKYGVENPSQIEEIKKKKSNTLFNNYNTNSVIELNKDKIKEKYGVENVFQSEEIKEKIKETNLKKYGVENPQQSEYIMINRLLNTYPEHKIINIDLKNKIYTIFCEKCNNNYDISFDLLHSRKSHKIYPCVICNPIGSTTSIKENELSIFINNNYDGEIVESDRNILNGKELDIHLPELNLAFEFNGVYWHNELYKVKNYHLEKTEKCLEKGIQLIHIWEDDWHYKQEIIKSMILNKLGKTPNKIFARKTIIKEMTDNKLVKDFLNNNHIQGFVGSSIKIGLFYDAELVSLMTFGKKRKFMNSSFKEGEYELLRFCNKLNTNVIGGASKLFKYFISNYSFREITTYANRNHSNGDLYKTLGFNFVSKTPPNYYYVVDSIRKHRFGFRKDVLIKEGYDPNKTEHEIMLSRKIYRIYDSGSLKYIF